MGGYRSVFRPKIFLDIETNEQHNEKEKDLATYQNMTLTK